MTGQAIVDRSYKALSLLLCYPSRSWQSAMPEIAAILAADERFTHSVRQSLLALCDELQRTDIYELEERYVTLFDRTKSLSLNLFEHVHGESRDRGSAMVSLLETYQQGGVQPMTSELPDHLPVLLEFLSMQKPSAAREVAADAAPIIDVLHTRLSRKQSSYAAVFMALLALADSNTTTARAAELLDLPDDDPNDLEALDAVWQESEVRFGPESMGGCNAGSRESVLTRRDIPVARSARMTSQ